MSDEHTPDAVEFKAQLADSRDAAPQRIVVYDWFAHGAGAEPRGGNKIDVLVDGEATWERVAEDLLSAKRDVQIATWMCRPDIELRRPTELALREPSDRGHHRLGAILEELAEKGTRVRLLIWGMVYTPLVDRWMRRWFWRAKDNIDVLEQDHPFLTGSHHQKTLTIDGRVGYCGGMNLKENDWDATEHAIYDVRRYPHVAGPDSRSLAREKRDFPRFPPRHDLMVRLEGPTVGDLLRNFWERWQQSRRARMRSALSFFVDLLRRLFGTDPYPELSEPEHSPRPLGEHWAQVVRTTPGGEKGILEAYRRAIRNARRYIYIENQYFRSPEIGKALRDAIEANERLRLIVVVRPVNGGKKTLLDPSGYYTALTLRTIQQVRPTFKLTQIIAWGHDADDRVRHNSVDVHAKAMVVDDVWVTVGSANINDRGFKTEGEINVVVLDKNIAGDLRRQLMAEHLEISADDSRLDDVDQAFDLWEEQGDTNPKRLERGEPPQSRVHHFVQDGPDKPPFRIGSGIF